MDKCLVVSLSVVHRVCQEINNRFLYDSEEILNGQCPYNNFDALLAEFLHLQPTPQFLRSRDPWLDKPLSHSTCALASWFFATIIPRITITLSPVFAPGFSREKFVRLALSPLPDEQGLSDEQSCPKLLFLCDSKAFARDVFVRENIYLTVYKQDVQVWYNSGMR
ncbi:hypothetical protein CEXT_11421 [Caerostris extrusa]|uniref:Uncharacterized protein n=1 Tax=Caerostris extrusa TaxID=172846 RepID=A0AAV4VC26_CAEEX|nr:hypothetical protein CEXT_11421 [Caerostris extrusa]